MQDALDQVIALLNDLGLFISPGRLFFAQIDISRSQRVVGHQRGVKRQLRVFEWLAHHPAPVGRIWLDAGVGEGSEQIADVRRMRDLMIGRGWKLDDTLRYAEDPEGEHDEMSWGRRLRENWAVLTGMLA